MGYDRNDVWMTCGERDDLVVGVDRLKQTIRDEWGSRLCKPDDYARRQCEKGLSCVCGDIAEAILSQYHVLAVSNGER